MCGIAGYVGPGSPALLREMLKTLAHRGPDDEGWHVEPGLGLGMTRLAIIDPAGGRQPMASADGRLRIVFNGEIYNFRRLRTDLEARGHVFRTRSDTEVILAAWAEWGEEALGRLHGMFAFALWDAGRRRLVLARDRLGKKPLHWWRRGPLLVFASEIKALLCHPAVGRAVDPDALHHYLAFGYTPADRPIFAGIRRLPPAHLARVDGDGEVTTARYWSLPDGAAASAGAVQAGQARALVRQAVREAVRLRLESDVPLGVFLSGGIDSSVVVACAREVAGGRLATFCVGFGPAAASWDERRWARLVAERFATEHHEEVLEPAVADVLPLLVRHFDEPFADASAVPTWTVAQATARHVKVALSGLGGDEAFAGYPRYLGVRLAERWARLPRALRGAARVAVGLWPRVESSRDWGGRARRFVAAGAVPMPDRYLGWTRLFGEEDLVALVHPEMRRAWTGSPEAAARAAFARHGHGDPVDGAFRIDLATYLPDDLLVMADRLGMAHSLEVRAPFCDHRLLETSLRLPPAVKLPGFRLKGLLKDAFADVLPRPILGRPKQGFMVPLARWLRRDLAPLVDDLLGPGAVRARGWFDPSAVGRLRAEHAAGRADHADRLWALVVLEIWAREYLDGAPAR
jgi:asparagine synthase (glutamine-hydrolysing)